MQSKATTVDAYLAELPEDRILPMTQLRKLLKKNLPKGFKEVMVYGSIGYVVPHAMYSAGYHTDPSAPLPFINLASQKNFIALYHMGIYGNPKLLEWFVNEYQKHSKSKPDMGKSCIRFKKPDQIPYELIAELMKKISVDNWIKVYLENIKKEK